MNLSKWGFLIELGQGRARIDRGQKIKDAMQFFAYDGARITLAWQQIQ